jgi:deoxycytidylate deaminase
MIARTEFISATMALAYDSACHKRHAAMVVKGRRVLGAATNKQKTHPAGYGIGQRSFHAEAAAMMRAADSRWPENGKARNSLRGCVLYSFRNGPFKKSRPCSDCIRMAMERGIKVIVYDLGPADPEDEEAMMYRPGFVAHWFEETI